MTSRAHRVLIVDDESALRGFLRVLLQGAGYRVVEADSGVRAQIEARSHKPDLLLLNLGLPDVDGIIVIRKVRAWSPVPIVVLSARSQEEQKIAALDAGADDYVTKPFSAPELLARVRAGLRRSARSDKQPASLKVGAVEVDLAGRLARGPQGSVRLTPLEFRVLECLARQGGTVVPASQILREVWGPNRLDDARGLRVCIKSLRDKLEPDRRCPRFLVTEIGLGYRLYTDEVPQIASSESELLELGCQRRVLLSAAAEQL